VAGIGQGIAAGMTQHVSMDRQAKAARAPMQFDEPVDGVRRERTAALGGEDEGAPQAAAP